jgi:hypothetical protein
MDQVVDLMNQQVLKADDNAFVEGGAVWRPLGELLAEQRAEKSGPDASRGPGMLPLFVALALVLLLSLALAYELRSSLEPWLNLAHSLSSPAGR